MTYGLIEVGRRGWNNTIVLTSFTGAAVCLAAFFVLERRSDHPVLPDFLFSQVTFSTCLAVGFVLNFSMYGILFVESVFLQHAQGMDALATGLTITPFTVLPTITSRFLGRRNGASYLRPRIVVGLALAAIGSAILAVAAFDAILWPVPAGLGILGISTGFIMPAMTAGVLTSSPPENSGLASGLLNSSRQVGGTIGVALLGTIMQTLPSAWGVICALIVASLVFLCAAELSRRTLR